MLVNVMWYQSRCVRWWIIGIWLPTIEQQFENGGLLGVVVCRAYV